MAGCSVPGLYSKTGEKPCQDACRTLIIDDASLIAVACDGAGSHRHSDVSAQRLAELAPTLFAKELKARRWTSAKRLPPVNAWRECALQVCAELVADLEHLAVDRRLEYSAMGATLIVAVVLRSGLLVAHVGDGRAAYRGKDGEWHAAMTPFKGTEVGSTAFVTSMSSASPHPELLSTHAYPEKISAFVLTSDGAERAAFACYQKGDDGMYSDPNMPFASFLDPNAETLASMHAAKTKPAEIASTWQKFIDEGNASLTSLRDQSDDKTMILGVRLAKPKGR